MRRDTTVPPKLQRAARILVLLVLCTGLFGGGIQTLNAANIPTILSYQGRLTDSSGSLLGGTGTNYYFRFSIWDTSGVGSGTRIWPASAPTSNTHIVRQGVFNVNIGDTANGYPDTLDIDFSKYTNLYLQVEVSSDNATFETLGPRQQITSLPYAHVAGQVSGTGQSTFGTLSPDSGAVVSIAATSSNSSPLSILGIAGQIADLFRVKSSTGAKLFSIGGDGSVNASSTLSVSGLAHLYDSLFVDKGLTVGGTTILSTTTISNLSVGSLAFGNTTGILKATSGVISSALVNLATDVTGILPIGNGGTGLAATPGYGQLLIGNGSGYALTATSTLGIALSDTTGTLLQTRGGTGITSYAAGDILYADAGGNLARLPIGQAGQVLKSGSFGLPVWGAPVSGGASSTIAAAYPLIYDSNTGVLALDFGTTTSNTWAGTQTFGNLVAANATTTSLSIGGSYVTSLTGSGLTVSGSALTLDRTGDWTGTFGGRTSSYYLANSFSTTSANYFISTKSTDALAEGTANLYYTQGRFDSAFGAKSTSNLSEGTNLYFTNARTRAALSSTAAGLSYDNTTGVLSFAAGYTVPLTASTTDWNTAYANRITSATSPLSILNSVLSLSQAGASANGYLSSADWNAFNGKLSTTSLGLIDKGYFFSTTSASYFASQNNFYSTTSADYWLSGKSTSNLSEGSNLYYTPARVAGVIAGTTTDALAEGISNLYFTNSRARAALSFSGTGLSYTSSTGVLSIAAGYSIPLTASTTDWNTAYLARITTATAPLSIANNTISISQANGSTNGYLSSTDWNSFNSRLSTTTVGLLDKGYFFSTTSAAYFLGQNQGLAFSTSSASYFLSTKSTTDLSEGSNLYYTDARVQTFLNSVDKGYFFSTTSAAYWKSQNNFYSTTSADYWLTGKSTTNLSEGTNLYYTPARVAGVIAGTTTDALREGTSNLYYTDARSRAALSNSATGLSYNTSTGALSLTSGYTIPLTASTTDWNTTYLSRITTASSPLTFANNTLSISQASGVANGYLSSADWSSFNSRISTSSLNLFDKSYFFSTTSADYLFSTKTTSNLAEGSNLYYTPARVAGVIAGTTTDALAEGVTNQYFTNTRARAALSFTGTGLTYTSGTGVLSVTSGFNIPLTASTTDWNTAYLNRITAVNAPLTFTNNTLSISQANAATNGYLASADWNLFNNKVSSTSLSALYPLAYNTSTGVFNLAFGTSTSNTWGGTQTFTNTPVLGSLTGVLYGSNGVLSARATSTASIGFGLTGTLTTFGLGDSLAISTTSFSGNGSNFNADFLDGLDSTDFLAKAFSTTSADYYKSQRNFYSTTSADYWLTGKSTTNLAEGSNLYYTPARVAGVIAGTTTDALAQGSVNKYYADSLARNAFSATAAGLSYNNSTGVIGLTSGYTIPLTASTTDWNTAYLNRIATVTAPLSFLNNVLSISQAGASANGYLTSADWNSFNSRISTTSLGLLDKGFFFSTTSADYYKSQNNFYSTTSADYWLTGKTTDNLAQGSTNKYYSDTLARAALSFSGTGLSYTSGTGVLAVASGYSIPLTASTTDWNTAYLSRITAVNAPLSLSNNTLSIAQANGSTNGYVTSADWTIFNNKVSSTSLSALYPLAYNNGTGVFNLAFGTSTSNTWGGTQTFTNAPVLGALTGVLYGNGGSLHTAATSTPSLGLGLSYSGTLGSFIGGTSGTLAISTSSFSGSGSNFNADLLDGYDASYFFAQQGSSFSTTSADYWKSQNNFYSTTSANYWLTGKSTTDVAEGTNLYYTASRVAGVIAGTTTDALAEGVTNKYYSDTRARSALSFSGNGLAYSSGTGVFSVASGYSIPLTASTTEWNTAYLSRISSASSPLSITNNVLSLAQASAAANGYLSSADWNSFNNRISTSSLALFDKGYFFSTTSASYFVSQNNFYSTTSADYWLTTKSTTNLTEGSNLYYTPTRVAGVIAGTTTDALAEGVTNQYFTSARARAALSFSGTGLTYTSGTGVLSVTSGYSIPLTASTTDWNTAYLNRITAANAPLSISNNTLSISQANASTNGYLTSSDWTLFNNKISSTSLSALYPLSYNSSTGVFNLAFGTSTSNTWGGTQTFTNAPVLGAFTGVLYGNGGVLSSAATSTPTLGAGLTYSGTLGAFIGGTSGTLAISTSSFSGSGSNFNADFLDGLDSTYFLANAFSTTSANYYKSQNNFYSTTSADYWLTGKSTTNLSEGTNLYYTPARVAGVIAGTTTDALAQGSINKYYSDTLARSALSSSATGLTYTSGTGVFSLTSGYVIPLTASTTDWNTAYLSRITSATAPLSITNNVLSLAQAGAGTDGYLTSADWNFFNSRISTTSLGLFDKGYFFSTTSASYFVSQNNFFSTTSANYWKTQNNFYSTTSADYWLTTKNTDSLAQGSTNKYYSDTLARGAFSSTANGLTYTSGTGAFSLTAGYSIPLTASTTEWSSFYTAPSTRITAGTNLSWAGNTLNGPSDTYVRGLFSASAPLSYNNSTGAFTFSTSSISGSSSNFNADFLDGLDSTYFLANAFSTTSANYYKSQNNFYSTTSADYWLTGKTTDNLAQGSTNKYYSDTLARGAFSSTATGLTYTSGTGVFSLTAGYSIPLTASTTDWNTAYVNRITAANLPLSISNNTLSISQANGSTNGYLGSADWNSFNNKVSSTSLSALYPLTYNSSTGVFNLAFGTSTSNTWGGTQTFTNTPVLGALTGLVGSSNGTLYQIATSTNFVTSLAAGSGIGISGSTGAITISNTGVTAIGNLTGAVATSTLGLLTTNVAEGTNLYFTNNRVASVIAGTTTDALAQGSINKYYSDTLARSALSSSATGLTYTTGTGVFSLTAGYSIPLTASTTDWNTAYLNRITSASSPLSLSAGVLSIAQAGSGANGYLTSADWNSFNSRISTSSLGLIDKGYFFSTTSAAYFVSQNNFYSTTSADYWLTTKNTDSLAQGSTNKYYSDTLARGAFSFSGTGITYTSGTGVFSVTSGYSIPLSASTTDWNTAYLNRITAANAPLTLSNNTLSISQANTSTNGYLASADWNLFNNKVSSTSLSAVYPLIYNSSTGAFNLAFGTTTANTYSALQTFSGGVTTNALTLGAVSGVLYGANGAVTSVATSSVTSGGTGITVTGSAAVIGAGGLSITNTGVTSNVAGTGISVSGSTGAVTITNTGATTVFGRTGAVLAQSGDYTTTQVTEGTNLYYTPTRVASVIAGTTTDALAEGTNNLYFTNNRFDTRFDNRLSATTSLPNLTTLANLAMVKTSLSGFLKATAGVLSTASINLASDITGTLGVGNGGTGSTTLTGLLKGNGTSGIASGIAGIDYQAPLTLGNLTVGTGLSVSGGTGAVIGSGAVVSLGTNVVTSVTNDTNVTGSISSNALTLGWTGSLAAGRGGTGITNPTAGGILLGTYAGGGWQQVATSSLGLLTTNVAEGTNLYFTNNRVAGVIAGTTTDAIAEGVTNKYYTDTRARAALSFTGTGFTYTSGTGVLSVTSGYSIPLTASTTDWNTAYINRITSANAPLSISGNAISISQAGTGTNGYLSTSDWNTFNNKISSTSLSANYPLTYNSSTGVFNLAFGTSTNNTWGGTQTFTNTPVLGALTGLAGSNNGTLYQIATSSNFVTSAVAGTGISLSGATGAVTINNTGVTAIGNLTGVVATSSLGLLTTNVAEGTNLYFTNARAQGAISVSGTPLTYSAGVIGINQANGSQAGYIASTDWNTFNNKISSTSLSALYPLAYNSSTGVFNLAFGTSTNNTWGGTQTFTNTPVLGALTGVLYGNGGVLATAATSTATLGTGLTYSGTLGAFIGGTSGTLAISTTSFSGSGSNFNADFLDGLDSTYFFANSFSTTSAAYWKTQNNFYSTTSADYWLTTKNTDSLAQGSTNKYYSDTLARGAFSSTATGLTYTSGTGVFSLTAGYSIPLTASTTDWNTAYVNRITSATVPLSLSNNVLSIAQANGSTNGYLSLSDWTTFNNKVSSTSLSALYPLTYNSGTGVFNLAFSTSTNNTWGGTQTFTNAPVLGALTGLVGSNNGTLYQIATSSNFVTSVAAGSGIGISGSTGAVTISNTGITSIGNLIGAVATSSLGLLTTNVAEGTNLYFTNNRVAGVIAGTTTDALAQGSINKYYSDTLARAAFSSSATGLTYTSGTGVFSLTAGYSIPLTASTTDWNTAYLNRITSASAPLTISGNAISISQAGIGTNGYLSSGDWNTFNGKVSSSSLSANYPLTYNSSTGVFNLAFGTSTNNAWGGTQTFTNAPVLGSLTGLVGSNNGTLYQIATSSNFVTSAVAGSGISVSGATGAVTIANTGLLSLAQTYGTAQAGALTFATSSATSFNGLTVSHTITNSGGAFTFGTPIITGTLNNTGLTSSTVSLGGVSVALGGSVAQPAFDLTNATNLPIISGTTGTLTVARGGTGWTNIQSGALLYGTGAGALATTSAGTAGQILGLLNGIPTWTSTTTAGTGLTYSAGAFNVNSTQSISKLSNLTTNGFVKTTNADGTLSIDTNTYLTTAVTSIAQAFGTAQTGAISLASSTSGTDFSITNTAGAFTFNLPTAANGVRGLLSSADWNTFNSKQSALTFSYPLVNSANTISLAFGTSTNNTWGGTQTFTNTPVLGALTGVLYGNGGALSTSATSTPTLGTGLTYSGTLGASIGGTSGTLAISTTSFSGSGSNFNADFLDGLDSTYFLANSFSTTSANYYKTQNNFYSTTSADYWLTTKNTDSLAQGSTNKYYSDTLARAAFSSTATGLTYTSGTGVFSLTAGYSIPLTASTTDWNTAYLNRITSASSPLSFSNNVLSIAQANGSTNGYLSLSDWTTFNNKISSTSLSANYPLTYNSGTGVFNLAFGTTSANSWSGLQTFTGGVTTNALTLGSASGLLYGASGAVSATATSTLSVGSGLTVSGGSLGYQVGGTNATIALASIAANSILGNLTGAAGIPTAIATSSLGIALSDTTGTLSVSRGGTGSTTLSGILIGNGTSAVQTLTVGSGLTLTGTTLSSSGSGITSIGPAGQTQSGATLTLASSTNGTDFTVTAAGNTITFNLPTAANGVRGLLSSADWNTFNNKQSALTFSYPLINTANTISLALSTTSSNTWGGTQTFTNAPVLGSLTGILRASSGILSTGAIDLSGTDITNTLGVANGGTGSTTLSGILIGNGTSQVQTLTVGSGLTLTGTTLSSSGGTNFFTNSGSNTYLSTGTNLAVGTTTPTYALTSFSATQPQLALSAGAGLAQWTFANEGGNFYLSTTTVAGTATTSLAALTVLGSSGNVGIGTTSPFAKLSISGSKPVIALKDTTTGGNTWLIRNGVSSLRDLDFYSTANNTSLLYIQSDVTAGVGEVRIGTSTNVIGNNSRLFLYGGSNGANLDAMGDPTLGGGFADQSNLEAEGSDWGTTAGGTSSISLRYYGPRTPSGTTLGYPNKRLGLLDFGTASTSIITTGYDSISFANNPLIFGTGYLQRAVLDGSGNFGVGTTSPWGQLSASSTSATPTLAIQQKSTGAAAIFMGGNVGIGTTSPSQLLSISGNAYITGSLTLGTLNGILRASSGIVSTGNIALGSEVSGILGVANGGTGSTTLSGILIGNGTSQVQTLTVGSGLTLTGTTLSSSGGTNYFTNSGSNTYLSTGTNLGIGTTTPWAQLSVNPNSITGPAFAIGSSTATNFIVTNAGLVGIGTTSPSQVLSVTGAGYFTGGVKFADGSLQTTAYGGSSEISNPTNAAVNSTYTDNSTYWGYGTTGNGFPVNGVVTGVRKGTTNTQRIQDAVTGQTYARVWIEGSTSWTTWSSYLDANDLTAKGQMFVSNGNNSYTVLSPGGDGTVLSAASANSTGLAWITPISAIGPAGQTQAGATITFATSTLVVNGQTHGLTIVGSGNALTFTPTLSGTLGVAGGGTGSTTLTGILLGNGTSQVQTLTVGSGLTLSGTTLSASGGANFFTNSGANTYLSTGTNLAVGTTTPTYALTSFAATGPQLALSAGAGLAQWTFANAGGNFYLSTTTIAGTATTTLPAFTIIGSTGNIGISTSSPYAKLSINGNSASGAGTSFAVSSVSYPSALFSILDNGTVGIGTTSPTASFAVQGQSTSGGFPNSIALYGYNGTSDNLETGGGLILRSGNGSDMVSGGAGPAAGSISILGGKGGNGAAGGKGGTGGSITLQSGSAGTGGVGAIAGVITLNATGGNVGIGTSTPARALTVSASTASQLLLTDGSVSADQWAFRAAGGNFYLASSSASNYATSSLAVLSITSGGASGYLGIGTSTPGSILSIGGVANFTTATTTFYGTNGGINLTGGGCFAISGVCVGSGAAGISSIGPTGQTQSGSTITFATSTLTTNGQTHGLTIVGSGNALTFTPTLSGTLGVAGGGTGSTTLSGILIGNGTSQVQTLTVGSGLTLTGTTLSSSAGTNYFTNSGVSTYLTTGTNLGIGTTTPWAQLSINPNGITGPAFVIGSSTATNFVVTNSGKVGIGTTSPFAALSIVGNSAPSVSGVGLVASTSIAVYGGVGGVGTSFGGIGGKALFVGGTGGATVTAGGTGGAGGSLELYGGAGGAGDFGGNGGNVYITGGIAAPSGGSGAGISGNVILGITSAGVAQGNVGIGTSTPQRALTISSASSPQLMLTDASAISIPWNFRSVGGFLYIGTSSPSTFATSTTPVLTLSQAPGSQSGAVGIGTSSPWGKLSVEMGSLNPAFVVSNQGSTTPSFVVNGVNQNGNVGVGTSSPWRSFATNGTVAMNGLTSGGDTLGLCFNGTTKEVVLHSSAAACAVTSDRRLKTNIQSLNTTSGLSAIDALRPVSFNYKDTANYGSDAQYGFIAQEVAPIFPLLVGTSTPTALTPDVTYTLNYQGFITPAIKAIQELSAGYSLKNPGTASSTIASTYAGTGSSAITVNDAGFVGIGTTAPQYKLEVNGTAAAQSFVVTSLSGTAPSVALTAGGVDLYKFATYNYTTMQDLATRVDLATVRLDSLESRVANLEAKNAATNASTTLAAAALPGLDIIQGGDATTALNYLMSNKQAFATTTNATVYTGRLAAGLEVVSPTGVFDGLTVNTLGSAGTGLNVLSDTVFIGRPYLNSDTAGFAIIHAGQRSVRVTFDRPYIATPVVTASVAIDDSASSGNAESVADQYFNSNVSYVVVGKSVTGFTIVLKTAATSDVPFNWTAFAVKNPKIFQVLPQDQAATATPTASTTNSSVGTTTTPAPGPASSSSDAGAGATTSNAPSATPTAPVPAVTAPDTTSASVPADAASLPAGTAPVTAPAPVDNVSVSAS